MFNVTAPGFRVQASTPGLSVDEPLPLANYPYSSTFPATNSIDSPGVGEIFPGWTRPDFLSDWRTAAGSPRLEQQHQLPPHQVADDLRQRCVERCTDLTLMVAPRQRQGTFDQCMAHCEGRAYWPQFQPLIPFPTPK